MRGESAALEIKPLVVSPKVGEIVLEVVCSMLVPPNLSESKVAIPESLRLQLESFRRHLWRVKIMEAIAAGIAGLLISFLMVYGLDRIWQTPSWARLAILVLGISLFAVFVPYWLHRWVWRQRRETQLARLIAKRYPGLGDRLLGVIELQNQAANANTLSPRLREAAMASVAIETGKRNLGDALPKQRHLGWTISALCLALVAAAALTLTPRAGVNALQRWLMPLSKTDRYTFAKLENPPQTIVVPFGEPFGISLRLASNSEQKPAAASGTYGQQPAILSRLNQGTYVFNFPGQQYPGTIVFVVGDLRHECKVLPLQRPSIESATATIHSPDYLQIPEKTIALNNGVLNVVEGSKVQINITSNRPLRTASFGPTKMLTPEVQHEEHRSQPSISGNLTINNSIATSPLLDVASVAFEIPFHWSDMYGLTGARGFSLRVDTLKDAASTCYLQGIERQKVMLPEETIDFELLAEDDFGLKCTGIEWTGKFTRPTDQNPAKGELNISNGDPQLHTINKSASFSPAAFGILPQKIILRAYSEDYFPDRPRAYSEPVIVLVVTRDEHVQMLKTKFDQQINELEDLTRREQELLDENQRLERISGNDLQKDPDAKRLEAQEIAEVETKRRMENLTERMENLMKDATRNGDIQKETLKKMAESLKSMQELSQQDVPKVQQKLSSAQEPSNTTEKVEKDIDQAVKQQEDVVKKMQFAIAKANDANKQFEAGTFVNRLKKAAADQRGIASSLINAYDRILGIKATKLDPSDQRRLSETSTQQTNIASEVRWLQEDLSNFYVRTRTDSFKQILDEMKASQIDLELEKIHSLLGSNHSYLATESSNKWANQFTKWAMQLEGPKDSDTGAGGAGNSPSPEDEDFEFMLRVMKLVQQEQDIRAQTRALEQLQRNKNRTTSTAPKP